MMNRTRNSHQNLVTNNATLNDEQKQLLPLQLDDDKLARNLDYQSVAQCEQLYRLSHDDRTDSFSMRSLESMPSTSTPQTEETKALSTNIYWTATALCAVGLLFLNVSVYQMLRGSGIIFLWHFFVSTAEDSNFSGSSGLASGTMP
jgi:hypothetical protein